MSTATRRARELDALTAVLAGEYAVIYGYGVAGAHFDGRDEQRARGALAAHQSRRDQLLALISDRGGQPQPAAAAYRLPFPVRTAHSAALLATDLEERMTAVWADGVASLDGDLRALAARAMQETAVRAAVWRGGSVPFPGLPGTP
jgi:hypothetical protein